jgi:hypothetical protein
MKTEAAMSEASTGKKMWSKRVLALLSMAAFTVAIVCLRSN